MPFALGSAGDGTPRLNVDSGLRLARARYRGDKRRINSELRAVPQWEAICDNLDASSTTGTSIFMSATRTLRATAAPASRQT